MTTKVFSWRKCDNNPKMWEDGDYWIMQYTHNRMFNANFKVITDYHYADLGDHETFEEAVSACARHKRKQCKETHP